MPKPILKSNSAFVGIGNPLSTPKTINRTNLILQSEDFGTSWSNDSGRIAVSANAIISPSGEITADKITENSLLSERRICLGAPTVVAGTVYTFSCYLKAGERSIAQLGFGTNFGNQFQNFIIGGANAGTLGSGSGVTSPQITALPNGWYRCTATVTATTSGSTHVTVGPLLSSTATRWLAYIGVIGSGIYAWGAQLEAGSYSTNYIKTTTTQVTITQNIDELKLFSLTQNCNFGVSNDLLKLKQIGSDGYAVNEVFQAPKVNLTLDYLHSPYLNNELLLGFNGSGSLYENALSGFNSKNNNFYLVVDNRNSKEGFEEVKRIDPLNIDFSGFSIFSFGDSYLTNYSLSFQIGQIPSVSTTFACSNMKIDTIVDSEKFEIVTGNFTWSGARTDAESRGGRLAVLNTEEKNNKVPTQTQSSLWIGATDTGVEGIWRWINGTLLNDGYTNWSAFEPNNVGGAENYANRYPNGKWNDLANTYPTDGYIIEYGITETKNQITTPSVKQPGILNLADSYYSLESGYVLANPKGLTEFNLPVTSPMSSQFILDDLQVGGIKLESYNQPLLQSLSIDIDLSRNDLYGLGSNYVYDRKLSYPINAKIDMLVLVSGVDDGFISGILSSQQVYGFTINCINSENYATGSYKFNNCRLTSFNYSMPLDDVMTFNASFDCTIRNDVGFEMKRVIGEFGNYYQDFDTIWGNLSINWESN
jgi:hypothetical protein